MEKEKINHDHVCVSCGDPATINCQNAWHTYSIDNNGDFNEIDSNEGDTNEFYCDKCWDDHNGIKKCTICGKSEDDDGRCGCTNKDAN